MGISDFISLDDSLWPLLIAKFVGQPSLQQQEEYFSRLLDYLGREEQFVGILDTRQVRMMTAEHRQRLTEFMEKHDALIRARCVGCAAVITSPVMQLVASLVLYFRPMPFPYYSTSTLPEAVRWTARCLEDAGHQPDASRIRQHYGLHVEKRAG
ncbi:STAS/SEC14 domain-containing protein [Vitiosangium sp. GDMCC 1.1324]|uniref:STAS/SEC14 domain-containing protein n=1 Tax=Vitiosangium sp. (strain GDMCC 1.1324) TaxID=2138576 RepID=UPI000D351E86|nr:STAS/SEC14 domain-containing protein [Vitiosangium sp. GDMCC 1.1324]PTL82674.1 hypothetical protein DAT35_17985 [Vitiosangium sp. GDMCC 1.1324]